MSATALIRAARELSRAVSTLRFGPPVAHVYNPLDYAWAPHEAWLRRYGAGRKRVVFVGMNPGPFGMMQTGVPFGEVAAVRDWMGLHAPVRRPADEHPKRPIEGFACRRSEVSGRRLWGWAAERFGSAPAFFEQCFVVNYCPLVFLEASGRNFTPERLPAAELQPLQQACDAHLRAAIEALRPEWAIGIGAWAMKRAQAALGADTGVRIDQILHPSPASPAANRGWAPQVDARLEQLGVLAN
ncbi:MAG: single-stranded DNA-binding protein [Lautropia sp.]|nr:MAG: single-strand selective monofunctional uracil-DNA glycosylase [Pseudomonadota bacterium]MBC6959898.1 single-stranded DNA-binding protein [Lautropia sp.]MCL4702069.1 single-stranded DNA-binding protein [Burkholderiaceae bacterium]MDL1908453.1 single-strand selective monofunctional uracil-DNA glycosylase [Betaproteobacteria bacterium PRO1]RIK88278.1 MAG: single-stranded DNA-binding protein [Burkholderiales bacterium]